MTLHTPAIRVPAHIPRFPILPFVTVAIVLAAVVGTLVLVGMRTPATSWMDERHYITGTAQRVQTQAVRSGTPYTNVAARELAWLYSYERRIVVGLMARAPSAPVRWSPGYDAIVAREVAYQSARLFAVERHYLSGLAPRPTTEPPGSGVPYTSIPAREAYQ